MLEPSIFHQYDIRGIWGKEWDAEGAARLARALAAHFQPQKVAVGRDMRLSSSGIFEAMSQALVNLGIEVWDYGLISTDISYFISGRWQPDLTLMITASHNPPEYNGLKVTLPGGESVSLATGLAAVKEKILSNNLPKDSQNKGKILPQDAYEEFVRAVVSLTQADKIKPLKLVVDAGNGMAGKVLPRVMADLRCQIVPLYFELDGSFPHHLPNPLLPEGTAELKKRVWQEKADLGAAFDGDGDRMVLVDEKGEVFSGTIMTAMLAEHFLRQKPGRVVCYNALCGRIVPEVIKKAGGIPLRTPVGYSVVKKIMRQKKAIFAGEHSYHFFFPDLYYADSGITALLASLRLLSESGQKASELRERYDRYFQSGEINFQVADQQKLLAEVEKEFSTPEAKIDHLDGVTINFPHWWFNLRPSNTQPVLRLNVEADEKQLLRQKQKLLVEFITAHGGKRSFD